MRSKNLLWKPGLIVLKLDQRPQQQISCLEALQKIKWKKLRKNGSNIRPGVKLKQLGVTNWNVDESDSDDDKIGC